MLQVSTGNKFYEIIEMIKKVMKNMKQTNYGKKIYDNLMTNFGEYFKTNCLQKRKGKVNTSK